MKSDNSHWSSCHSIFFWVALLFFAKLWCLYVMALSLLARIWGECSTIHSLPALFFFKVEICSHILIPLFMPGLVHSGSASWGNWGQVFPDKLWVNSFPERFPHSAWTVALSAHSNFVWSRVYVHSEATCHLHFGRMTGVFYVLLW